MKKLRKEPWKKKPREKKQKHENLVELNWCCCINLTLRYHKIREMFVLSTNWNINESFSVLKCTGKAITTAHLVFLNKSMKHCSCTACLKLEMNKLKGFRSFKNSVLFF